MTQSRLNSAALRHVQQKRTDSINLNEIAHDFTMRSTLRKNPFGVFGKIKYVALGVPVA